MPFAFDASRPDRSREASLEQPRNMEPMSVALAPHPFAGSFKSASDLQPENMAYMLTTFVVSSFDKSAEASELQPLNMSLIFVTFDVSRPERSAEVK